MPGVLESSALEIVCQAIDFAQLAPATPEARPTCPWPPAGRGGQVLLDAYAAEGYQPFAEILRVHLLHRDPRASR